MMSNSVLAAHLTDAHRELEVRARSYFRPEWLEHWRTAPGGPLRREAWTDLAAHGFLGVAVPRDHGGEGLGLLGSLILAEALAGLDDAGVALGTHVDTEVAAAWLLSAEDAALRETWLPRLLAGDAVACQCDTDPSPDEPTTASLTGEEVEIRGRKRYVVNGAVADLCFVAADLDGQPAIVLVEKDRPGVRVRHVYDKLGTRSVDSALLEFDAVRVPRSHVVTRRGLSQLMAWNRVMSRMRYLIAADAFFIHRRLLAHAVRHTTTRRLGGRTLAQWPVNAHALARARADQELMEAGLADAYVRLARGAGAVPEVAELKWFCVERATELAGLCTDLEGGAGFMWDSPSLRAHAQLRGLRMAGGSQTTMLTIANHSLACRAELAQPAPPATAVEATHV
ncbi:acyl-CoA dehydrogenase family protein [Streptomyces flaveolus]|uniref:acyl-CoA dehydrogenase family protein n=1 Tax=Streptomyces flaveolus TaxID=67297 RepID=UPI00341909F2